MGNNKIIESRELEFKEWGDFLKSTNDDLNELNMLAKNAHNFGSSEINKFVIALKVFISSKSPYIYDKKVIKNVDEICDALFSMDFIADLAEKNKRAIAYQYKALKVLLKSYEVIVRCLSESKVIPIIIVTKEEEMDAMYYGASV